MLHGVLEKVNESLQFGPQLSRRAERLAADVATSVLLRDLSVIVAQQAAQPLATVDVAGTRADFRDRLDRMIVQRRVAALAMKMLDEFADRWTICHDPLLLFARVIAFRRSTCHSSIRQKRTNLRPSAANGFADKARYAAGLPSAAVIWQENARGDVGKLTTCLPRSCRSSPKF
jgi:hypothetical protein